jgi:aryl-alcohol dehydrogenase-like predicted oxidoreductase
VSRNPVVTAPIVGGTKVAHIEDAVASLELALTDDEVSRLEEHYVPHAVVGF